MTIIIKVYVDTNK